MDYYFKYILIIKWTEMIEQIKNNKKQNKRTISNIQYLNSKNFEPKFELLLFNEFWPCVH